MGAGATPPACGLYSERSYYITIAFFQFYSKGFWVAEEVH
jgi:hypothetical protein